MNLALGLPKSLLCPAVGISEPHEIPGLLVLPQHVLGWGSKYWGWGHGESNGGGLPAFPPLLETIPVPQLPLGLLGY